MYDTGSQTTSTNSPFSGCHAIAWNAFALISYRFWCIKTSHRSRSRGRSHQFANRGHVVALDARRRHAPSTGSDSNSSGSYNPDTPSPPESETSEDSDADLSFPDREHSDYSNEGYETRKPPRRLVTAPHGPHSHKFHPSKIFFYFF